MAFPVSLPRPRPPSVMPRFLQSDTRLRSAVPNRLLTWFTHSSFSVSTPSPYGLRRFSSFRVLLSPSDRIVVYRSPWHSKDRFQSLMAASTSIMPDEPATQAVGTKCQWSVQDVMPVFISTYLSFIYCYTHLGA